MKNYDNGQEWESYEDETSYDVTPYEGNNHLESIREISQLISTNQQVLNRSLDLSSQIASVYFESKKLDAQVDTFKEMSKVKIAEITTKFLITKEIIEKTFAERGGALSMHYKALDDAIKQNDREGILNAMKCISSIVVTSPLEDIQNFTAKYNDTSMPLLDF